MARAVAAGLALLACAAAAVAGNKLPSEFKLCKRSDPSFDACLSDAVGSGIKSLAPGSPELNTPPLDPLAIPKVVIPGNKNAPVNINLEFSNIVLRGIKGLEMTGVTPDVDHYKLTLKGTVPNMTLECDYIMDGRILLIPANGNGRVHFGLTDLKATVNVLGEERTKKGASYMKITDFDFKMDDLGHLDIKFDNLFNGDKTLGDSVNNLLNENWQELWAELRSPYEQVLEPIYGEYAKRVFDRAPYNEIFLP